MPSTSLEIKLRTQAAAYAPLTALLGTLPTFRWYGPQAPQGALQPMVEVQRISAIPQYSTAALLETCQYRMQFTVWHIDLEGASQVERAIRQFLTVFNAYNAGDMSPIQRNRVVNVRVGRSQAQTQPITYWITLDAFIWNNELL